MDIRMIAMDLDGTLLNENSVIDSYTLHVLEQAYKKGILLVAATGRAFYAVPKEVSDCPFLSYIISSNGTGIYECKDKQRIYSNLMSEAVITALLSLLSEYPYPLEAFIDGHAYAEAHYVNHAEAYLSSARSSSYVKATRTPVENMPDFIKKNITNIEGMDIVVSDPDVKQTIRKRAALIVDLYITSSAAHYIEFAAGNASKETALSYLLSMLSFDSSNLIAFGDSENDLEMLHFAKAGIAMGNAGELVKKQADYITASNTQHGVAEGILHFIPDIKMESLF